MNNSLRELLNNNKFVKIGEIIVVFIAAFSFIKLTIPFTGDNLIAKQAIIWIANILMLFLVWMGMKIRCQKLIDFGITFDRITLKESIRTVLLSLLVLVASMAAFVLGSIIMANITGIPENPDMSNYGYLTDNLAMLILTLLGVYIVSSFGEEVIYRAFLINRLMELGLDTRTGRFLVVLISAAIFGFAHYEWGPMGIVQTGFMGVVLGFFYIKLKKRIWILVLAHAYMDTLIMIQMYMESY
jgi:membrane protease YdiL (CAAX protease family)